MIVMKRGRHFAPYVNKMGPYGEKRILTTEFDTLTADETELTIDVAIQGVEPRMIALNGVLGVGETAPEDVCCWRRRVE